MLLGELGLVSEREVRGLDARECAELLESGKAELIDVREQDEWLAERIPGAELFPLSRFNERRPEGDGDKIGIFHCRSGRRTFDYFPLFRLSGYKEVFHMEGGILDWKAQGYPTER